MTENEIRQMYSERADPSSAWVNYSSDVEIENKKVKVGVKAKAKKNNSSDDSKTDSSVKRPKALSKMTISELKEKAQREKPAGFLRGCRKKEEFVRKFEEDENSAKKGKDKSKKPSTDNKRKRPGSSEQKSNKKQKTKKSDQEEDEEETSAQSKRKSAPQSGTPISPRKASLRSQSGNANDGEDVAAEEPVSEEEEEEDDDVPETLRLYART
jgi:hypothetical protein